MNSKEYRLNRLETTKLVGKIFDKHWAELREAKQKGEKVAWCSGPTVFFPQSQGIKSHFMAGYSAYCAGRGAAEQVLEAAEAAGELSETCSYHRLHTGMVHAVLTGYRIKEEVILPIPDLFIIGRLCPEMSHYAEALFRRLGKKVKVVGVDLPPPRKVEDLEVLGEFVENQIREVLIPAIEELTGREFDYEALRGKWDLLKKIAEVRNKCWEFFKLKPTPWTLWDYGVGMGFLFYAIKPEGLEYWNKVYEELKERAKNNVPAILPDGEKYRLYWDNWIPWAFLGKTIRLLVKYGAIPIFGRYPYEFFPHPEYINLSKDPIKTWVDLFYVKARQAAIMMPEFAYETIAKHVEEYGVDGIIFFSTRTCRMWNAGQREILNRIEREYGIPGVIIEADMVDSRFFNEAQIELRLQTLFEMIDARRKK